MSALDAGAGGLFVGGAAVAGGTGCWLGAAGGAAVCFGGGGGLAGPGDLAGRYIVRGIDALLATAGHRCLC